ncbi:MAG: hypothetical protein DMF60_04190 [Acidobacteria bacterium]|nr:MAG: hypothetical protein DMF60_04190 [Acidobacteriota bacterium]
MRKLKDRRIQNDTIGLQPMEVQLQPNLPPKAAHSCHRQKAKIETPSAKARWYPNGLFAQLLALDGLFRYIVQGRRLDGFFEYHPRPWDSKRSSPSLVGWV